MTENYFALLGVDKKYDIDLPQLKANNLRLQHALHPDRQLHQSSAQQLSAANKLAQINQAFATLNSSYHRGEYLLSLMGIAKKSANETIKNPQLLIQQMDLRERLSEIRQLDDPEDSLQQFSASIVTKVQLLQQKISTLFDGLQDAKSSNPKQLQLLTDALTELQFISKLQQEILRFEEQLDEY